MLIDLIISIAIAIAAFLLIWLLRGVVLTPVPKSKNINMQVVIDVSGEATELENTVDALVWLRKNGTLDADIIIRDMGMGEETARVAGLLKRSGTIEITN